MTLDLQYLLETIKKAPKLKTKERQIQEREISISGYVLERFLLPFLRGNSPCTADLDFENIGEEDMEEMLEAANVIGEQQEGILQIWAQLQQAGADSAPQSLFF